MSDRYVIRRMFGDEAARFLGLRPNTKTADAAWTTERENATRFSVRRAAEDTALALLGGTVEPA